MALPPFAKAAGGGPKLYAKDQGLTRRAPGNPERAFPRRVERVPISEPTRRR